MRDLSGVVRKFAARLRRDFRTDIEQDPRAFKARAVGLLRRNLPPQRGRPCCDPVTCAFRLRARKKPWPEVYRACLPRSASIRDRFNLRVAVRMRRLRLRKRRVLRSGEGITDQVSKSLFSREIGRM